MTPTQPNHVAILFIADPTCHFDQRIMADFGLSVAKYHAVHCVSHVVKQLNGQWLPSVWLRVLRPDLEWSLSGYSLGHQRWTSLLQARTREGSSPEKEYLAIYHIYVFI